MGPRHTQCALLGSSSDAWALRKRLSRLHLLLLSLQWMPWPLGSTQSEHCWILKERKSHLFWNPAPFVTGICYERSPRLPWLPLTVFWRLQTVLGLCGLSKNSEWDLEDSSFLNMRLSQSSGQLLMVAASWVPPSKNGVLWHPHMPRTEEVNVFSV